jgi:aminocarboxymuconate-semialdehyde decarboxylase
LTVVDVHTHFIPRFVLDERGVFGVRYEDGMLVHPQGFRYPVAPEFVDVDAKLAQMDRMGIDVSLLSSSPTLFFYEEDSVDFARRSNDALASLVSGEDRLHGLATLPLQAPSEAARELERAVGELGLLGAQIGTNCGSTPLDAPALDPVLATADRLGVPLMLHPYYVGPKPGLEDFYLVNSAGNPLDTCIAAVRLIHSGALDRYPSLRIVLVHGGGFLPYQVGRFDHAFSVRPEARVAIDRAPSSYLGRFWMDTITHGDLALGFLASLVGTDRMVLGTDLPFDMADGAPVQRLERVGLDADLTGQTAAELFGLAVGAEDRIARRSATRE